MNSMLPDIEIVHKDKDVRYALKGSPLQGLLLGITQ